MKIFLLVFLLFCSVYAKELILGVVPQQSPLVLHQKWKPLVEELSKMTGLKIVFKTEASIPLFEKALYSGQYDLAYMNPYHFVIANKKLGLQAALRADKMIQGVVVSKNLNRSELFEAQGGRFLFPAPKAFAATLLVKYELKKKYKIDLEQKFKVLYVNSHDSVYKGVARGIGVFGGGIVRTFNNLSDSRAKQSLSIVYRTDTYPSHPIGFHPKVSLEDQKKVQEAFLKIPNNIIEPLNIKKFITTSTSEYDIVKDLALELGIY